MKLLRRQLEKVRSQKIENQNDEMLTAQPAQPAQHSIKELSETLPQALIDWLQNPRTQGGDEWPIPPELLPSFDDLVTKADALVRERDPRWRIWHGNKCLRLKAWVWDSEPPPYRRPRKQSKRYP